MLFGFSKTRFSPIGVDFGADSLKLLQVTLTDPPQLVAAAAQVVPEESRGDLNLRILFFADTLPKLIRQLPFSGRRVICSLPSYQVLIHHLQVNRHDDPAEIRQQIDAHLRERLNVDPARLVVRHHDIATVVRDGTTRLEVLCMAVGQEVVSRYLDLMQRCRLDVVGLHAEPPAIVKSFGHLYRRADDASRTTAFIDIGAATTKLVIAHGKDMAFAKALPVAGDHLARQYAAATGKPLDAARRERRQTGASQPAGKPERSGALAVFAAPIDASSPESAAGAAVALAQPPQRNEVLDCLIDELQLCLRHHQSLFPARPIEKVVFLGGESRQTSVCQQIARALRVGAQLGDPLARVVKPAGAPAENLDLRQPQPGWAVPLGLCLSDPDL